MKRLVFFLTLTALFIPIQTSTAAEFTATGEEIIEIADTRNRDLNGNFYDRSLEERLQPTGSLGSRLERAATLASSKRILVIDPMLIEEVQDLADGFSLRIESESEKLQIEEVQASEIAISWLNRLSQVTGSDEVGSLNYGNPDTAFLARSAPSELRIHLELSRQRLAELLSRDISPVALTPGVGQRLQPFLTENFTENRREIRAINRYAKNPETRRYRLINASLLDPSFDQERAFEFARDLNKALSQYRNSIRITSGRYTLTSSKEKIPVTLINDFTSDLSVRVTVSASNTRVIVGSIDPITIPAQSKEQFTIPIEVLSSGQSDLVITLTTESGRRIGPETRLPLTLAVISPLTTWITTGSGIVLLLAAIVQSLRRIRKSRKKSLESLNHE
jgi:Family of unknown function (DUF6049)